MLFSGASPGPSARDIRGNKTIASDDRREREQRGRHCRPAQSRPAFLHGLEFLRQLRIADFIGVEVHDRDAHAMFHFACAEIVQERSPLLVFFEIFGDMLGKKDVSGVAAIHHPLRHVDSGAGEIGPFIYIDHAANRPAVDSHPKLQARMFLERAADLHRALHRRFRTGVKDQRHPVAGWDSNQTVRGFGSLKLLGGANNLVQFLNRRVLVVNRKLRVANDVDEQDMRDLELDLLLDLGGHVPMRFIHILQCPVEEIKIDNHASRGVARYHPGGGPTIRMRILNSRVKLWRTKKFRGYSSVGRASRSQRDFGVL